jgi:hypothetical protein
MSAAKAGRPVQTSTPTFTVFDYPGTNFTSCGWPNPGTGTNQTLKIVGYYFDTANSAGPANGYLLEVSSKNGTTTESYTTVEPTNNLLFPSSINDLGEITGTYGPNSSLLGFLYSKGVFTEIIAPFAPADIVDTVTNGINDSGTIVGAWSTANVSTWTPFIWKAGVFTQVAGYPGAPQTYPWAINNRGEVSGQVIDTADESHGYILQNGVYTLLDYPGADYTAAFGINDSGDVVGEYCTAPSDCNSTAYPTSSTHGFLYSKGTFTTIDVAGEPTNAACGINSAGLIVGLYAEANGYSHGYFVNPNPAAASATRLP